MSKFKVYVVSGDQTVDVEADKSTLIDGELKFTTRRMVERWPALPRAAGPTTRRTESNPLTGESGNDVDSRQ